MSPFAIHAAAVSAFAAALPLSIAGANMGWALMLLSILVLWKSGERPDLKAVRSPLFTPLLVFLGAALLASALGIAPLKSLRYFNQDLHKLWLASLFMLVLSRRPVESAARWIGLGFAVAAAVGAYQALSTMGLDPEQRLRARAFVHPVTFGEQMAVGFLGAFCFFLKPPPKEDPVLWRRCAALLCVLTGTALLLSHSRGAVLAAAAGLAAIFAASPDRRRLALLAVPVGAAALVLSELLRWDRSALKSLLDYWNSGTPLRDQFARVYLWEAAWRMGLDYPLTGVGHNAFRLAFPQYIAGKLDGSADWGTAHNLYLHHFAERGLIGLAALAWLLWKFTARAFERAAKTPDAWSLWAWGTAISFLVMNLSEVALQVELVWMLVFFVWCWSEARHRLAQENGK